VFFFFKKEKKKKIELFYHQVSKNPTFGRSMSRPMSRGSAKEAFPEAKSLSPANTSPAITPVNERSPVSSPSVRAASVPDLTQAKSPKLQKRTTGMVGMAAAFDALITAEERDPSPGSLSPARRLSVSKSTEDQLAELQARYALLEKEHEELKLKYKMAQATSSAAVPEKKQPSSPPPGPPLVALRSASANSLSSPVVSPTSASSDSVKEELSRVRREIKQQLQLPLAEQRKLSDDKELANSGKFDVMEDSAVEKFERAWLSSQNVYSFGDWRFSRAPGRSLVVECEVVKISNVVVVLLIWFFFFRGSALKVEMLLLTRFHQHGSNQKKCVVFVFYFFCRKKGMLWLSLICRLRSMQIIWRTLSI
jgi:hypothetical protein